MSTTQLVGSLKEQLEQQLELGEGYRKEAEHYTAKYHKIQDELLVKC